MPTAPPLDIKVVYSASKRRRKPVRGPRPTGRGSTIGLIVLGLIHLALASGIYYGTWWYADRELRIKLIMNVPMGDIDMNQVGKLFGSLPEPPVKPGSRASTSPAAPPVADQPAGPSSATVFVGSFVTWEVLATLAACAMSLSAGALLGRAAGPRLRPYGLVLTVLVLIGVAGGAYHVWSTYGIKFQPFHLRIVVGGLVLWMGCLGLAIGCGVRRLLRLASVTLILSALGTAAGLYVGTRYDAFKPADFPLPFWPFLAATFLAQSLWGWVLIPIAARIRS